MTSPAIFISAGYVAQPLLAVQSVIHSERDSHMQECPCYDDLLDWNRIPPTILFL